jgi:hypothetical protein
MESPSVAGKALFILLSSRAAIWEVLQARRRACLARSVDATEPAGTVAAGRLLQSAAAPRAQLAAETDSNAIHEVLEAELHRIFQDFAEGRLT